VSPELGGTWFVVPTPFHEERTVDLESQRAVVEAAIGWGVDGLTVMGVTSEAVALTPGERARALAAIGEAVAGRVPVVVGCSGGSEEVAAELAHEAADLGGAAAMVSAPPLWSDVDRLPVFFAGVGARSPLPLVVQDEPAATGVTIPVDVLLRCVKDSSAGTVKLEDAPTPPKVAALLEARPDLGVFGGLGGVSALEELRAGACGTMTGFAFPEVLAAVREAHETGDADGADRLFDRYARLIRLEAGGGVALRKELLRRRGAIRTAVTRRFPPPPPETLEELDAVLAEVGIRPGPQRLRVG
jgi:4-hydroxy-tetrahydrodipicolinate synthase